MSGPSRKPTRLALAEPALIGWMVTKLCQSGLYEALSQASRCRRAALDPRHYGSYMDSHFHSFSSCQGTLHSFLTCHRSRARLSSAITTKTGVPGDIHLGVNDDKRRNEMRKGLLTAAVLAYSALV